MGILTETGKVDGTGGRGEEGGGCLSEHEY